MYVWFFVFHINRMENSVLGNALEGVPEESEEEEQPSSSNVETPDNPDGQYLGASDFYFFIFIFKSTQIILACVVRVYVMNERWDLKLPLFTLSTRFSVNGLLTFLETLFYISVSYYNSFCQKSALAKSSVESAWLFINHYLKDQVICATLVQKKQEMSCDSRYMTQWQRRKRLRIHILL